MSKLIFDATTVAPQQPIEAIPAGWYKAAVTESELAPTADGTGTRLKYEMTILEGPFKGRKVFDAFNIENKNPQAVEISQQQLSALCHATGVLRVQDSSQLHNIPVGVKVSLDSKRTVDALNNTTNPATKQPYSEGDPGTKTYEAQNRVKSFKNANNLDTVPTGAVASASAPSWAVTKPAAPAKPATSAPVAPAALATTPVAAPKGPKSPKKAPAKPTQPERKFYVYLADDNMPIKTESEIAADFVKGMPTNTPLLIEADIESGDWKDAAQYNILASAPKAEPAAPASNRPPWER